MSAKSHASRCQAPVSSRPQTSRRPKSSRPETARPETARVTSLVAAIDFGTTYSGYVYSFREHFSRNPLHVYTNEKWPGCGEDTMSVPTSVLLNNRKHFVAFGYEAEEKYAKLALNKKHHDWYLYRRFKMTLHNNENLTRETKIEDEEGRRMRALDIFTMAIKYIKSHLMETLRIMGHETDDDDVHWVLTVPAIWTEAAKQFMEEAANNAGIPLKRLTLALEPEAAAVFCKELTAHKEYGQDKAMLRAFDPGSQYLVLDLGGGTVDVTIQEVKEDGNLKVLDKASGGAWGGVTVDKAFLDFIKSLIGVDLYRDFATDFTFQKIKFEKELESCKRKATPGSADELDLTIPVELKEMYENKTQQTLKEAIRKSRYSDDISINGNIMQIKPSFFQEFYDATIIDIITHVKSILKRKTAKGISSLLLVGGFAESRVVQKRIKEAFDRVIARVIVPHNAGLAIVKGAVIYGHNPRAIAERVSPYTYGVETRRSFNPERHPLDRKIINKKGNAVVDHVFDKHIEIGRAMYIGESVDEHIFYIIDPTNDKVFWNVFKSEDTDPVFCNEYGCKYIGKLEIKVAGLDLNERRQLGIRMACRGTVLEASVIDAKSGRTLKYKFNFLGD